MINATQGKLEIDWLIDWLWIMNDGRELKIMSDEWWHADYCHKSHSKWHYKESDTRVSDTREWNTSEHTHVPWTSIFPRETEEYLTYLQFSYVTGILTTGKGSPEKNCIFLWLCPNEGGGGADPIPTFYKKNSFSQCVKTSGGLVKLVKTSSYMFLPVSTHFYLFYLFLPVSLVYTCLYLFLPVSTCFYLFYLVLSVFICFYLFLPVSTCFYLFLPGFICFHMFLICFYLFLPCFIC